MIRIKKNSTISNKNFNDNIDKNINHISINFPSFKNISNNNSNLKLNNNSNNKSFPKKHIYNAKRIFKSINTDFFNSNNDKFTTTSVNFFSTKNNNNNNVNNDFYRDKILNNPPNTKNIVYSERITINKNNNLTKKRNEMKKNNIFSKPFDLNSLVYISENVDIKDTINKLLNAKNIMFNEINYKYNCQKKN